MIKIEFKTKKIMDEWDLESDEFHLKTVMYVNSVKTTKWTNHRWGIVIKDLINKKKYVMEDYGFFQTYEDFVIRMKKLYYAQKGGMQ